ncbi:hypothetical protein [Pseudomonas leptonychotis]|uniref:hypothetical protein n=1 Tax=Pseudomonas leptonychotis TaxID=2448482 RepID=UPI0039EE0FC2
MGTVSFTIKTIALMLFPALLYCLSILRHGDLTLAYLEKWLVGNFMYMAAPHYLTLVSFFAIPLKRHTLIISLATLNIVLFLFQAWVWFAVPPRESGLAWIFYFPLSALCLCLIYCALRYKRNRSVVS